MIRKSWKVLLKPPSKFLNFLFQLTFLFGIGGGVTFFATSYEQNRNLTAENLPEELKGLKIQEKIGSLMNLDLMFTDDRGQKIYLKKYFQKDQPVLMTIIYYECPNLCNLHLDGLASALKPLSDSFKQQFEWVVISMDHRETITSAYKKKNYYSKKYSLPLNKIHFLTGKKENILQVSEQLGFRFRWDQSQKIYAHLPVAYVLTSIGKISRYLYGVDFLSQTLKLSLVSAGRGQIGSIRDRILLFCFQFDPHRGRYSWYAYNIMRAGGLLTVLLLLGFLAPVWIKENRKIKKRLS